MIEYYESVRQVHVFSVILSGAVFSVRGALVLLKRPAIAGHWSLRYLSYVNDTVLFTAAVMLVSMLPAAAFANGWLYAKLSLLMAYITLGVLTMRGARSGRMRGAIPFFYVGALVLYGAIFSIARFHHPLGILASI